MIGADALFNSRSEQLAELTIRHRVPAIYQFREFVSRIEGLSLSGLLTRAIGHMPIRSTW